MNPFLLLVMASIALLIGIVVFLDLDRKLEKRQEAENGHLIIIEGLEGVGKSKLIRIMKNVMPEDWFYSKEPYNLHKPLREWNQSDFQADRELHVQKKILPLLAQNKTLILNRYWFSACVYDGYSYEPYLNTWPEPDLVIWLDKEPSQEQSELSGRSLLELDRQRENYDQLFRLMKEEYYIPVVRIEVAQKTEEEIFYDVCEALKQFLNFEDPFKDLKQSIDQALQDSGSENSSHDTSSDQTEAEAKASVAA
ncbi:MAG: hypothetical protein SFT81_07415 [Candidatus Caenarcaniphilales bacterium]|nr:hypothetical protein [Candidatus Caenarcaniphilales bacterium]